MADYSSSEIAPHPGQATHDLECAQDKLRRLRDAAIARGDDDGAAAWSEVMAIAAQAIERMGPAKARQTWGAKRAKPCEACKR